MLKFSRLNSGGDVFVPTSVVPVLGIVMFYHFFIVMVMFQLLLCGIKKTFKKLINLALCHFKNDNSVLLCVSCGSVHHKFY